MLARSVKARSVRLWLGNKLLYQTKREFSHSSEETDKVLNPKDAHFHSPYAIYEGKDGDLVGPIVPSTKIGDIQKEITISARKNVKDLHELWPQLNEKERIVFAKYFSQLYIGNIPQPIAEKALGVALGFDRRRGLLNLYFDAFYQSTGKYTNAVVAVSTIVSIICAGYMSYITIDAMRNYFDHILHPHEAILPPGFIYKKDNFFDRLEYHAKEAAAREAILKIAQETPDDPEAVAQVLRLIQEEYDNNKKSDESDDNESDITA